MARRSKNRVFSPYHALEEAGFFDDNTANASSDKYVKAEYPQMFYHPKGELRVVVPAEIVDTPFGPKMLNEQKELISAIAADAGEAAKLRAAGWWDHPSKAHAAAGRGQVQATSATDRIAELEAEIRKLQALRNTEAASITAAMPTVGASKTLTASEALAETIVSSGQPGSIDNPLPGQG